jgi:hypothetical protein
VRNGFRVGEAYHVEPSLNRVTAQAGTVHPEPEWTSPFPSDVDQLQLDGAMTRSLSSRRTSVRQNQK